MKTCTKCKVEQTLTNFVKGSHWCKACKKAYDIIYRKTLRSLNRTKEKMYGEHTYRKYKLRIEDLADMVKSQGGKCPICTRDLPDVFNFDEKKYNLVVDHDHACCPGEKSCGKCVRGILCRDCNLLLGHAKDNKATLKNAIKYLGKGGK